MFRLALFLLLVGCSAGDGPGGDGQSDSEGLPLIMEPGAPIQTDALSYTARYERGEGTYAQYGFDVVARFTNPLPDTVYLDRSKPDSPRPTFGVGGSAYSGAVFGTGHDRQFAVAPGETRTDTLHVSGPNLWDGRTGEYDGWLEGRMRLRYAAQGCRGDGACRLPDSVAVSNMFRVRLE